MKVAFDLRLFGRSTSSEPNDPLLDVLKNLFERDPKNEYLLYCTLSNYLLFEDAPPNVRRLTLQSDYYHYFLDQQLLFEGDVDVLVRTRPVNEAMEFPLSQQVVYVPDMDHEICPERNTATENHSRRLHVRYFQAEAAAFVTPNVEAHEALRTSPWTRQRDVVLLSAAHEGNVSTGADELRRVFERVIDRRLPPLRVYTPPTVSIVTPSYQQGRFLRRTIDSVLSQDYPHIDYRVVDGGSTDETVDVLKSYGNRFPWVSERDRGQTHAINKGLALAKGQILAYLNSDDTLRPGAVAAAVDHFHRNPACDMVYGRGAYVDQEDRYLGMYPTAPYSFARLMQECCVCQPAAFWTRRIAEVAGTFDESYHLTMDYDYWLRIDRAGGRIEHSHELLAHSRMYNETKSGSAPKDRLFAEIYRTSFENGGYVDPSQVRNWVIAGLEPRYPWIRPIREPFTRRLHQWVMLRYREPNLTPRAVARVLARTAAPIARRTLKRIPGARRAFNYLRNKPAPPQGLRADNWLLNSCRFSPPPDGSESPSILAGQAPVPMRLAVWQGGKAIATFDLPGGEPTVLSLPTAAGRGAGPIALRFSDHVSSLDRQKVSFHLHGTNLLPECRDVA